MSNPVLAVLDTDSIYCERLTEYLRNHLKLSFEIQAFTKPDCFEEYIRSNEVSLLVVTESCSIPKSCRNVIVLDEDEGHIPDSDGERNIRHISKYVPASTIVEKILEYCTDQTEGFAGLSVKQKAEDCRVLGFFTPISRCGQTAFALKMGEILSRKARTIYLSFESFSALSGMFPEESQEDITDLLYYADCERDKFCLYLEKIRKNKNGLDIIAPAKTAMQIKEISYEKVKELITLLTKQAGYEYIILDLKEYPDGFFEILNMCDVVYTVSRNNSSDHYRIGKYNQVLSENAYADIIAKTIKCSLPDLRDQMSFTAYVEEILDLGMEVQDLGA